VKEAKSTKKAADKKPLKTADKKPANIEKKEPNIRVLLSDGTDVTDRLDSIVVPVTDRTIIAYRMLANMK
jgi:hypothetical protein